MPLTTPKIFCQADTSDIYASIKEIRAQFPGAPVFAVGFSLGGYTLNKYVGQVDTAVYPQGQIPLQALLATQLMSESQSAWVHRFPLSAGIAFVILVAALSCFASS